MSIISDLEVEDEKRVPFRLMRYPIEDGKTHSELFARRSNWFVTACQFDRKVANEWTTTEFNAFYGTQSSMVNMDDPGNTIEKLRQLNFSDLNISKAEIETTNFFQLAQKGLIAMTPMKTYAKHRYHSGANTKLLDESVFEAPHPVSFWVANGARLANVLSQMNQTGYVGPEELNREILAEKNFVFAAQNFGKTAANIGSEHLRSNLDSLHRQMEMVNRKTWNRGQDQSDSSSDDFRPMKGPRPLPMPARVRAPESVISTENETYVPSNYNQPRVSLPKIPLNPDLLPGQPKIVETPNTRLDRGRSTSIKSVVTRSSEAPGHYRRPERTTIAPEDFETDILADDSPVPLMDAR